MAGPNFDPAIFDKPEIKHSVLEGLVTQRLMMEGAREAGLVVSDEQMAQIIATVGAFQKDGKFDKQQYEAALRSQGMTPAMFEYRVRQDLTTRQLTDAFTQNGYAADAVATNLIRLNEQQRVVSIAKLDLATFTKQAQVSDAAVKTYFEQNPQDFQIPERAKIEFVTLSIDALMEQAVAKGSDIKAYYEEHLSEFGTQEQRQAAHILISLSNQASDAEKAEAKSKAEQVLKQVKQSPSKFAELAKQHSQDPGSAVNGGDLGMFGRGAMVKPFEESVFSLKVGEVSDLVQSDFGYHIIKLVAIKAPKVQPLSDVKAMIEQRVKFQQASDKFAELAEKFSNTLYEQSKDKQTSATWNEKVVQAVFSEDVLKNKRNTAAIEIAPNTLMAARVAEYQAATVRPLNEVAAQIRGKLLQQQAKQALVDQGKKLLEQLQKGEKTAVAFQSAQTLSRAQHADMSQETAKTLFGADTSKLPAYVGIEDAQRGYVLARIDAVKDVAVVDEMKRNRYAQQIRQITGEEMLAAYLADAKKNADITMKDFAAAEKK